MQYGQELSDTEKWGKRFVKKGMSVSAHFIAVRSAVSENGRLGKSHTI